MLDNRFRPSSCNASCGSRSPTVYVKALKEYKMPVFLVEKGHLKDRSRYFLFGNILNICVKCVFTFAVIIASFRSWVITWRILNRLENVAAEKAAF